MAKGILSGYTARIWFVINSQKVNTRVKKDKPRVRKGTEVSLPEIYAKSKSVSMASPKNICGKLYLSKFAPTF